MGWFGNSYERELLKIIKQIGFRVICVHDDKGGSPSFAYSVGFPDLIGQPEVIVFGLPFEIMGHMIGTLSDQCRAGLHMEDGMAVEGLLEGHVCIPRAVKPEHIVTDYFNSAMWYQQRQTGTDMAAAFQIVWPSAKTGLFPWDAGCADEVRALQPALYEQGPSA